MKIATLTLNPAIDQTVLVDHFQVGVVNRGQALEFNAGGKGVNVASFLADYGCEVAVTGFLGEDNQAIFQRLFAEKRIDDHFIRIPGLTRTNVKIADIAHQQTTDINPPGLSPSPEAMLMLRNTVEALTSACDWFVLSGNLPPGLDASIYAELIAMIKAKGRCVALDTSREALRLGLQTGPTLAKPNIHELEEIMGQPLNDAPAVAQAARQWLARGLQLAVVSMGERGAVFINEAEALVAVPPAVTVRSTVGAGDALVAGLVAGLSQNASLRECAQLATAYSVTVITQPRAQRVDRATVNQNISQVSVRALE